MERIFNPATATGDFFEDELPKADLYILARILHDWPDEKVHILLKRVADACTSGKNRKKNVLISHEMHVHGLKHSLFSHFFLFLNTPLWF